MISYLQRLRLNPLRRIAESILNFGRLLRRPWDTEDLLFNPGVLTGTEGVFFRTLWTLKNVLYEILLSKPLYNINFSFIDSIMIVKFRESTTIIYNESKKKKETTVRLEMHFFNFLELIFFFIASFDKLMMLYYTTHGYFLYKEDKHHFPGMCIRLHVGVMYM